MVMNLNQSVKGKTYSLFGNHITPRHFYDTTDRLTGQILAGEGWNPGYLLDFIQRINPGRRTLKRRLSRGGEGEKINGILIMLHDYLQEYTTDIEGHLRSVPFYKILTDKDLLTTREQYYLYMIEFGLVNRIHQDAFHSANYRIALLPYCLRESQVECRAEPDAIDYQCKSCQGGCYISQLSRLLKKSQVAPYIWRTSSLEKLIPVLVREHGTVGIAGVACLVELVMGMRRCMKARIPVVGIPLNANRCPRWMGEFHETSVDLDALERLLIPDQQLP
jgi:hypothetical protein